jgi:hypothetical protein
MVTRRLLSLTRRYLEVPSCPNICGHLQDRQLSGLLQRISTRLLGCLSMYYSMHSHTILSCGYNTIPLFFPEQTRSANDHSILSASSIAVPHKHFFCNRSQNNLQVSSPSFTFNLDNSSIFLIIESAFETWCLFRQRTFHGQIDCLDHLLPHPLTDSSPSSDNTWMPICSLTQLSIRGSHHTTLN